MLNKLMFLLSLSVATPVLAGSLHTAAEAGKLEEVIRLVKEGADPNERCNGYTALQLAASSNHLDVVQYLVGLLDIHLEVTAINVSTSLLYAILGGHLAVVQCLVAFGANLDAATPVGSAALYFAEHSRNAEVTRFLRAQSNWLNTRWRLPTPSNKLPVQRTTSFGVFSVMLLFYKLGLPYDIALAILKIFTNSDLADSGKKYYHHHNHHNDEDDKNDGKPANGAQGFNPSATLAWGSSP